MTCETSAPHRQFGGGGFDNGLGSNRLGDRQQPPGQQFSGNGSGLRALDKKTGDARRKRAAGSRNGYLRVCVGRTVTRARERSDNGGGGILRVVVVGKRARASGWYIHALYTQGMYGMSGGNGREGHDSENGAKPGRG